MDDLYPTELEVIVGSLTVLLREEKDVESKIDSNSKDIKTRVQKEILPNSNVNVDVSNCIDLEIPTKSEHQETPMSEDNFSDVECTKAESLPIIKKLFKQIALFTHPDKIKDVRRNKLFLLSRTAQDQNDIITLLFILSKCTPTIALSDPDILEVKVVLEQRHDSLGKKKDTVTYKWDTFSEEVKQILIKKISS